MKRQHTKKRNKKGRDNLHYFLTGKVFHTFIVSFLIWNKDMLVSHILWQHMKGIFLCTQGSTIWRSVQTWKVKSRKLYITITSILISYQNCSICMQMHCITVFLGQSTFFRYMAKLIGFMLILRCSLKSWANNFICYISVVVIFYNILNCFLLINSEY